MRRTPGLALMLALALALVPAYAGAADPSEHYQRSYELEATAEYAKAILALDQIDGDERQSYFYRLRRGWLLYLAGRHWDAMEEYRRAIKTTPASIEARLGLSLPQIALHLWLDAKATCEAVLRLDPNHYTGRSRLAYIHYNLGRFAEAEELYRALLVSYPADVEMRVGLAWSLFKQSRLREAMAEFRTVQRIAPKHPYNQPPSLSP
ncbi:MAG: tetratricopeptide repeat protein [Myxococcales bacterium]|nr:tetratricopeptide repeat protein [Myxococcales bacterium]